MAPRRRRRFLGFGDDLEAKRAREAQSIEECARLDLDDSPDIAESTEKRRKGLMMEWKEYVDVSCFRFAPSSANSIGRLLTATVFSYFRLLEDPEEPDRTIDPDSVWLDLCLNDGLAKARCVAFLKAYVKDSQQEFPILVPLEETGEEPQETEWRRTITSAHSLLNIWRSLIAEADATVLLKKGRMTMRKRISGG
jgi:hypothetical protein